MHTRAAAFQQLDVDYYLTKATPGLDQEPYLTGGQLRDVPVVRMFGVNETGEEHYTHMRT